MSDMTSYYLRKHNGRCVKCGEPVDGEGTMCLACKMDSRQKTHDYDERHAGAASMRYHRRKEERLAKGLCVRCGKNPHVEGKTCCQECADKHNKQLRLKYKRRTAGKTPERVLRVENSLCYFCGKPALPGKKTCSKCCESARKNAEKGREALRNKADYEEWKRNIYRWTFPEAEAKRRIKA